MTMKVAREIQGSSKKMVMTGVMAVMMAATIAEGRMRTTEMTAPGTIMKGWDYNDKFFGIV